MGSVVNTLTMSRLLVTLLLSACLLVCVSCLPFNAVAPLMGGIIMETLLGSLTLLLRSMCGLDLSRRNSHLEARQTKLSRNSKNKDILNFNIFFKPKISFIEYILSL